MSNHTFGEVTVQELAIKLTETEKTYQFVDVREISELEIVNLPQFLNLPLSESQLWSVDIHSRLDLNTETFVLCHHGMRSAHMCQWLIQQGFLNVNNIVGGIDAYAQVIDRSLPKY